MLNLSFGLREYPDNLNSVWGARWIYPDDQVWDRQDFAGIETEDGKKLKEWLDTIGIRKAMEKARRRLVSSNEDKTIVLYEDEVGIIKGNPQGSHGYMYVCGYLRTEKDPPFEPIRISVCELHVWYKAPVGTTARRFIIEDVKAGVQFWLNEPDHYDKRRTKTTFEAWNSEGERAKMTPKKREWMLALLKEKGHDPLIIE